MEERRCAASDRAANKAIFLRKSVRKLTLDKKITGPEPESFTKIFRLRTKSVILRRDFRRRTSGDYSTGSPCPGFSTKALVQRPGCRKYGRHMTAGPSLRSG